MVIEPLYDDIKNLRTLLLINKFSFQVEVPPMHRNSLQEWTKYVQVGSKKNPNNGTTMLGPEKLAEHLFASAIHSRRAAYQPRYFTRSKKIFVPRFLEKNGLQPPGEIESSHLQVAAPEVSPTTVNYSRYLT
ncbi:hypothetical protein BGZ82_001749, partial [Podila clonocystis]